MYTHQPTPSIRQPHGWHPITKDSNKNDPLWYRRAILYEVHVRAFFDSNGDGKGDFQGLAQKIPYLKKLGVTCLWLLPFCDSPLKDDGYDVRDYCKVHSDFGDITDFKTFLDIAHQHGLRVIVELVMNHTSDQHMWFKESRKGKDNKYSDYYVWGDDPDKFKNVRIIFLDTEKSNWTYDEERKQYFWHRFFSHQPDLNYDCPAVWDEMMNVARFWAKLGVDGFRADAAPYLYQREGTSCENLPESHHFFKELRKMLDKEYPGTCLLSEANQMPAESVQYFGNGDEFHLGFHFPLMPKIFMALKKGIRQPIVEVLKETPPIPPNCQWVMFLRNHDELTLEMVTEEERQFMWEGYASEHQMRCNLGIRRRLLPLLDNDQSQYRLLMSLLISLPGTPVLYYGDEIGMGDNVFLGDRNGVRTPMQWNIDRNAGFSRGDRRRLYLPVNEDEEYGYMVVNVEREEKMPHSILNWTRKIMHIRQEHLVFAEGMLFRCNPSNPHILAFLRVLPTDVIPFTNVNAGRVGEQMTIVPDKDGQQIEGPVMQKISSLNRLRSFSSQALNELTHQPEHLVDSSPPHSMPDLPLAAVAPINIPDSILEGDPVMDEEEDPIATVTVMPNKKEDVVTIVQPTQSTAPPGDLTLESPLFASPPARPPNSTKTEDTPSPSSSITPNLKRNSQFGIPTYIPTAPSIQQFPRTDIPAEVVQNGNSTIVLCVYNFAPTPQYCLLDLPEFDGYRPIELTGGETFPTISNERPYLLTLPQYGWFWFELRKH
ncbi:putative Trehalose synthase/amylase TreS [Blattamonas nauphoetae]|uniref:maltose alpha-D-glucosyltransferase n=1 Tax=Blattamonas nauphoetae TaxID=2049346 RepID=A0ABQ9WT00_9EUKA|nr:putative Trehalose synthase/amylase TreS [Blattamonas nauphoetae]